MCFIGAAAEQKRVAGAFISPSPLSLSSYPGVHIFITAFDSTFSVFVTGPNFGFGIFFVEPIGCLLLVMAFPRS